MLLVLIAIIIFICFFSIIVLYKYKNNIAILNIFIVIIILFNIYYWFYYRKMIINRYENFKIDEPSIIAPCGLDDNCYYSVEQLKKSGNSELQYHTNFYNNTIANDYNNYTDIRNGDPLLAFSCMKVSPNYIKNLLLRNNRFGYKYSKLYNMDENSLNIHIENELKEIINIIKNTNNENNQDIKIKGPIYAMISQSPYLRYNGDIINARFDTTNNKYSYYNEIIENNKIVSSFDKNKSLYTEILLIFPSYYTIRVSNNELSYKLGSKNNINVFINSIKHNFESNNDLCFLKCNNSFNITCGCLNTTSENNKNVENSSSGPEGDKGYNAKCLSEKNVQTDYSMLYFLNPYNPIFNKYIINHLQ